ncbi:MAG: hypothetical protein HDQ87_09190 [Clostridia bacterium]|nr:hypothetical protein [Clostridia bacterium]
MVDTKVTHIICDTDEHFGNARNIRAGVFNMADDSRVAAGGAVTSGFAPIVLEFSWTAAFWNRCQPPLQFANVLQEAIRSVPIAFTNLRGDHD